MTDFEKAVKAFPIASWLSRRGAKDSGAENIRVNCPSCGGYRTLGVNRNTKLAHCFKCVEGFGREWNGKSNLVGIIKLFDRCDDRTAYATIFRESGVSFESSTSVPTREAPKLFYPEDSIELSKANVQHAAYQMMTRRGVEHLIPTTRVCVSGKYAYRVILQAQTFGELHGFEAKAYSNQMPKALYPEWMDTALHVYTTQQWDATADFAILTESIIDAETYRINALGLYGSVLRDGQLAVLVSMRSKGIKRLIWSLDQDAWRKQCRSMLSKTTLLFENYAVDIPKDQDPNSLGFTRCWDLVSRAEHIIDPASYIFRKMSEQS